jgi:anti-sigma regulatory factor (Ser/Thr protein kinase)
VSVVGSSPAGEFLHEAFLYRGDDEFVSGVGGFVREGLADGDVVVVAEPADRLELLRDSLAGEVAADGSLRFLDMADVGANPARIIAVWAEVLQAATAQRRGLRGVGEPAFPGRRPVEFDECHLHELLLNRAFDGGPAWRLVCPYDVERVPELVRQRALHSHPVWSSAAGAGATGSEVDDVLAEAFAGSLPAPAGAALRGEFGPADIAAVRRTVAAWARSCALPAERVEALELAASELATNAVVHGGGSGSVAMWEEPAAAVLEFTSRAPLTDPLTGRLRPAPGQEGGAGLYLVNHLCDLVQVRSGPAGTAVRVTTWR